MGVTGSGMSGVASLASKMGYEVSGCDLKLDGHDEKHLKGIDLLVISPAILYQNSNHPEYLKAKEKGIALTWEEFVGKYLMKDKFVIAIAGTHGKSTTTAMVAKILEDAGFDPTVIIGANVPEWNGNSRFGKSKYFVIEADEFNDNFLHYNPDMILLNNIEFDHPDYFKNEEELQNSFDKFIKRLKPNGTVFTQKDNLSKKFDLKVFGGHNQKNANMAYLIARKLGISDESIRKSLENFRGIGRRMELVGNINNTKIYDDYAHHPTAIKTTLEGLRSEFKNKKILAVIEPHGYKRTKALLPLYKNAFDSADAVIIGPIYKARDIVDKSISISDIAKISGHKKTKYFERVADLIENCELVIENYDYKVIVVMGAGNSSNWAHELISKNMTFKNLTTLKVGGKIKYFFEVKNKEELVEKMKFAKENKLPIFVIGGGSDIAAGDKSFDGLVIKYIGYGSQFTVHGSRTLVTAEAGMSWDDLVKETASSNLQGMECLSGIPGTVGASPIQNIGAYGQELSDTFESLTAYDIEKEKFVKFTKGDCKFGYRHSIFKSKKYWQKFVITDVTFNLNNKHDLDLEKIRKETLEQRRQKLEDPKNMPNAGSFFINPFINSIKKKSLEKKYPEMKFYEVENDKYKISAGFLIEKAGWKGKRMGRVKVSDKHALILTNPDGLGNFSDIKKLADAIIKDVYEKFGIKLEPEVQYINI